MTGKVIDRETAGFLVLLIPMAIAAVVLLTAWPYVLAFIGLLIAVKIWQNYQWLKRCERVNPYFNQLIKENQGCLTAMDLSLKANLTGGVAQQFLEKKAQEFGAQKRVLQDKGTIYYFLTASALGSIFDESEPLLLEEKTPLVSTPLNFPTAKAPAKVPEPSPRNIAQLLEVEKSSPLVELPPEPPDPVSLEPAPLEFKQEELRSEAVSSGVVSSPEEELIDEETDSPEALQTQGQESPASSPEPGSLIQADLAKRLEINPSTIGRRKLDPDFAEWSQTKDPDGLAWKYVRKTKMFVPIKDDN